MEIGGGHCLRSAQLDHLHCQTTLQPQASRPLPPFSELEIDGVNVSLFEKKLEENRCGVVLTTLTIAPGAARCPVLVRALIWHQQGTPGK